MNVVAKQQLKTDRPSSSWTFDPHPRLNPRQSTFDPHPQLDPRQSTQLHPVGSFFIINRVSTVSSDSHHTSRLLREFELQNELTCCILDFKKVELTNSGVMNDSGYSELFVLIELKTCIEADEIYKICSVIGSLTESSWAEGLELASTIGYLFPEVTNSGFQTILPELIFELAFLEPISLVISHYISKLAEVIPLLQSAMGGAGCASTTKFSGKFSRIPDQEVQRRNLYTQMSSSLVALDERSSEIKLDQNKKLHVVKASLIKKLHVAKVSRAPFTFGLFMNFAIEIVEARPPYLHKRMY
ncbi:hypothetical protein Ccrd_026102 [Cynara cardunculus var. scolymus]|uniref:Uncharacterized protein n=1 Tax=Cynara cardunculus var. scolymus TaxID=59895 RepID=A0A103XDI6_CYNCS|nr:hypothetical protein Ccrd_026102 [Cynara cardunculus var. scolymus]